MAQPSADIPTVPEAKEEDESSGSLDLSCYDSTYDTLDSIGKGAFGFVKLARRKHDQKEVGGEKGLLQIGQMSNSDSGLPLAKKVPIII